MSKTIREWEVEKNMVLKLVNADEANKPVDEATFDNMVITHQGLRVLYNDRIEWLTKHGYELTRENMVNIDLTVKSPDGA